MRIVVTGAGGMLGRAVVRECERRGVPYLALTHREFDIASGSTTVHAWTNDVVINCAGKLPGAEDFDLVRVNALGPHYLATAAKYQGFRLIHVSTDCVFSGSAPLAPVLHQPQDRMNPDSMYGLTKQVGETIDGPNVTIVRTSFVGPDHGLWKWMAEQPEGARVQGWRDAWWSGSTVWEVAEKLVGMAVGHLAVSVPVVHLATVLPVSKYDVLLMLRNVLKRPDIIVDPVTHPLDRSLAPTLRLMALDYALDCRPHDD